jgi:hypothetical protein
MDEKKPTVTPENNEYVVRKIWFEKGFLGGGTWKVQYSKRNKMNSTSTHSISRNVRSFSVGRDKFYVDWP